MAKKMLIDATQAEETRVAVLDNNGRLEEFDLEITSRQQIKGNIYLAKVTRVEPSLQAAFVNFGGNRHGFLPFSEIHPDYYRIPVSDREALQAEIEAMLAKRQEHADDDAEDSEEIVQEVIAELEAEGEIVPDMEDETVAEAPVEKPKRGRKRATPAKNDIEEVVADEAPPEALIGDQDGVEGQTEQEASGAETPAEGEEGSEAGGEGRGRGRRGHRFRRGGRQGGRDSGRRSGGRTSSNGGGRGRSRDRNDEEDGEEDIQNYIFRRLHRTYKIQEVIKRGQIMLVQATKEERGNKGAAMTTYMSLPGRYSVLMPNSPRSGGVSRKVHDRGERDRLRDVFSALNVPDGMSVILRTAGINQKSEEIQRDYSYLQKNWGSIREKTLASTAPALIYQEGSVVKRAIRDIFREDVSDIFISGREAFDEARIFMDMLVPAQAKRIKEHKGEDPLFVQHRVEEQISAIDNHTVTLKSGGYLVFAPTEALVSIDINSGRSTRERHIEETALNTNLEAAEEIARQLRLRDIGGLIVIDFIDMEDHRHNILVERKLESALSKDRARIQIGRISQFGLLELSRQRLRPSLTESHFMTCPTCQGSGMIRTTESMAIVILRAIAQEGSKAKGGLIALSVPQAVCLYLLNQKRDDLTALENRYELQVQLSIDPDLGAAGYKLERQKGIAIARRVMSESDGEDDVDDIGSDIDGEVLESDGEDTATTSSDETRNGDRGDRNNRRRGRRGGRGRNRNRDRDDQAGDDQTNESGDAPVAAASEDVGADPRPSRGRGRNPRSSMRAEGSAASSTTASTEAEAVPAAAESSSDEAPKQRSRARKPAAEKESIAANDATEAPAPAKSAAPAPKVAKEYEVVNEAPESPKKGWWRKVVS